MMDRKLLERIQSGAVIDLAGCTPTPEGGYILEKFIVGKDYWHSKQNKQARVILRNKHTGHAVAFLEAIPSHSEAFELPALWMI